MSLEGKKVLVIDDEENIVKLIQTRLTAHKYVVSTASNGKEGLDRLKKEKPDLIILDVMMPVMDGFEFFKNIKKNPDQSKIPVLVLTARSGMRDTFEALDVDDFIPKPFEAEQLLSRIENVFKHKVLLYCDDASAAEKISEMGTLKGVTTEVAENEDQLVKKGMTLKCDVFIAYLGTIKKEPKDFVMMKRMFRSRNAKLVIFSDVKATGSDSTVTVDEIKTKWERAGVDVFYDQVVCREKFSETFGHFFE